MTPYERIDSLEVEVRQLRRDQSETLRMLGDLSSAFGQQSALLAGLLNKLGESADTLPGEQPVERTQRQGRKAN